MLEMPERRKIRENEILVWDRVVRVGHWLLVLAFATLYLRYDKFPLHSWAGYIVTLIVVWRLVWGFVGADAARFRSFAYGPAAFFTYLRQAFTGHAGYYPSHNPMGAAMVYLLIVLLLADCALGIMLSSAGQQLGPLGEHVPADWEDSLLWWHTYLGHATAACVAVHILGVIWAARLHRENYVLSMLDGYKRVPRHHGPGEAPAASPAGLHVGVRGWLAYRHPLLGTLLLIGLVVAGVLAIMTGLAQINSSLPAY